MSVKASEQESSGERNARMDVWWDTAGREAPSVPGKKARIPSFGWTRDVRGRAHADTRRELGCAGGLDPTGDDQDGMNLTVHVLCVTKKSRY